MLTLNVLRVMTLRGINKTYSFLTAHGFTHHTAHRIIRGKTRALNYAHLEKLCHILHCQPHDLLDYTPSASGLLPKADSLLVLKKDAQDTNSLLSLVTHLSLHDMQIVAADIAARFPPGR